MNGPKQKNACIDLGSNMCRLLIGQPDKDQKQGFTILRTYSVLISLGKDESLIHQKSIVRTMNAIQKCKNIIDQYPNINTYCIATAIFRSANNAKEIINEISEKYKLNFRIIDPGEEVTLSAFGCIQSIPSGFSFIMDMGGGSTEIGLYRKEKNKIQNLGWISLPCGLFFFSTSRGRKHTIPMHAYKTLTAFIKRSSIEVNNNASLVICRSGIVKILSKYMLNNSQKARNLPHSSFDKKHICKSINDIMQFTDAKILERKLVSTNQHLKAIKGILSFTRYLINNMPINNVTLCRNGLKEGMMHLACKE